MSKFKIGDRIRLITNYKTYYANEGELATVGPRGVYTNGYGTFLDVIWDQPCEQVNGGYWPCDFELVNDPIGEAKLLLEQAGYTITPPPEKKKGRAYIYKNEGAEYGWFASVYSPQERKGYGARDVFEPIAIIDWEEGQGL